MKHQINYTSISPNQVYETDQLLQKKAGRINEYIERLLWWNKKINLISRDVSHETLIEHVRHSAIISQSGFFQQAKFVVDAGSGGGLPGLPLAILYEDKEFILNDIVAKKMMSCKSIINEIGVENVTTITASIANVEVTEETVIVSKHAFKINELLTMLTNQNWKKILLLKGSDDVEKELEGIMKELEVKIIALHPAMKSNFYKGKALVEIQKA